MNEKTASALNRKNCTLVLIIETIQIYMFFITQLYNNKKNIYNKKKSYLAVFYVKHKFF